MGNKHVDAGPDAACSAVPCAAMPTSGWQAWKPRCRAGCGRSSQSLYRTVRKSPSILVVSCLATIAMITACVLGVTMGASVTASALQVQAQQLGLSTLDAFSVSVKLAQEPLHAISAFVRLELMGANWTVTMPLLRRFLADQIKYTAQLVIQVDPSFVGTLKIPPGIADANLGLNLLLPGSSLNRTLATLRNWPNDAVIGPIYFNYGGWGVNIKHLIYVNSDIDLSQMDLPFNPYQANCSACRSKNPGNQLWGICSSNIDLTPLRNGTDPSFARLTDKYRWKLWRTGDASPLFDPSVPRFDIAGSTNSSLKEPMTLAVEIINGTTWYLDLEPDSPTLWQPTWRLPLLIVLPIVCVMVGLLLLSREVMTENLGQAHARSEALLYRMLPPHAVARLREGKMVEATSHPEVTILFSDIVGFTELCAKSSPMEVCAMLNQLYLKFDQLLEDFPGLYKVETIGDAYMVCANLTQLSDRHVNDIITFAMRMQQAAGQVRNSVGAATDIRIGIHTGPVVAGVVGSANPRFCLFGDTVNTASRMESHGLPGKVHISSAAYERIMHKQDFEIMERGNINVKGKGMMRTYLIDGTPALQVTEHVATRARRTSYVIPAEPLMLPLADPPVPLYTGPHMAAFASEPGMQLRAGTLNPQRAQLNLAPSPSCTYSFEADSPGAGPRSQGLEGCMSAGLTSITTSTSYGDSAGAVARFTPSFSLLQAPSGRTSSGQMGSFHVTLPCPPKVAAPPVLRKLSENRISTGGVVMNAGGDAPQAASAAAGTPGTSQASGSTASGVRPDTV